MTLLLRFLFSEFIGAKHIFGLESAIIGEVTGDGGKVLLKTFIGGT